MTEKSNEMLCAEEELDSAIELTVGESDVGERLDSFVSASCPITRSAAAKLAESGNITVNGATAQKNYKLRLGDGVSVYLPTPADAPAKPQNIPLQIVYEDEDIIVINKPQGMVVHPAPGNEEGTLVNALLYHCADSLSGIGGVKRPGIVHRIDKDTAGLIVCAKNDAAHLFLAGELKEHKVARIYSAIVLGNFKEESGTVDAPIGRHPQDRKRMAVIRDAQKHAREAVTHWSVLKRFGRFTLVSCELETGRTHQIRVHMSSIGHPLLGDSVYGGAGSDFEAHHRSLICGQCLFARELRLTHPRTKEKMNFYAEYPENFSSVLEKLEAEYGDH